MKIVKRLRSLALGVALLAVPASALADTHACVVKEVRSYSNRVHVRCANKSCIYSGSQCAAYLPIVYFAVPASDWSTALRFASVASMALGHVLEVEYKYYDVSATSFGCQYGDCRQALSFWMND